MIQQRTLEETINRISEIPKPYSIRSRWYRMYYDIIFEGSVLISVSHRHDAEIIQGALNGAYMLGWLESELHREA